MICMWSPLGHILAAVLGLTPARITQLAQIPPGSRPATGKGKAGFPCPSPGMSFAESAGGWLTGAILKKRLTENQ